MREIKFRCFYEGKMHEVSRMEFSIVSGLIGAKKYNFMQYTGLKDKLNQNEVYEHDIISHIEFGFLKVEWDYQYTGWICLSKDYKKYNLVEVLLLGGILVGNIHENKELLV